MVKKQDNNNMLMWIIVILLLIIVWWGAYFIWKWGINNNLWTTQNKNIEIIIINDKRDSNSPSEQIVSQLKLLPALANAKIEQKDFSDSWVSDYLKDQDIKALPAIIFNTNYVDPNINSYLSPIKDWKYSLNIWAQFNPFLERSERWFLMVDKKIVEEIKKSSYIKWKTDSKITWLEYSDLECPFCAKLHNATTEDDLIKEYGDNLNIVFNHFPLDFHKNAMSWAQILECAWEQKWSDAFYSLIKKSFKDTNSTSNFLIDEAVKLWANKSKLEACLDSNKYKDKVNSQMKTWSETFGITWTPWNVLINNETWEYEILSGAYPTDSFKDAINRLSK
jgi:protein-disulfide isomerase